MFSVKYKIIFIIFLANLAFAGGFFIAQNIKKTDKISDNKNIEIKDSYRVEQKQEISEIIKESESDKTELLPAQQIETPIHNGQDKTVILQDVPFTPQAPLGNWQDMRQENGCEEASAMMAMAWVRGKEKFAPAEAEKEIIAIADYELEKYGDFHDTSAKDTAIRIFNDYFNYDNIEVKYNVDAKDIKNELIKGNLVVVPVNGQKLKNLFYKPPGPIEHMIVIVGYDNDKKEFITNDPGTKRGEKYRYKEEVLEGALQDYPTGFHEPILEIKTAMIVVSR